MAQMQLNKMHKQLLSHEQNVGEHIHDGRAETLPDELPYKRIDDIHVRGI